MTLRTRTHHAWQAGQSGSLVREVLELQEAENLTALSGYALWRLLTALRREEEDVLDVWLHEFECASEDDQMRLSLRAEYGHVLPILDNSVFFLREDSLDQLVRSQNHRPDFHPDWSPLMPLGLVLGARGRTLLDGHHRVGHALVVGMRTGLVVHAT